MYFKATFLLRSSLAALTAVVFGLPQFVLAETSGPPVPVPSAIAQSYGDEPSVSDTTYYYDWSVDANGNKVLNEVPAQTDTSYTVNIDSSKNLNRNQVTEGADVNGNFDSQGVPYNYGEVISKGGAIENTTSLGNIDANFVKNHATLTTLPYEYENGESTMSVLGGAIYNAGSIGNIIGDYAGNFANLSVDKNVSSTWDTETNFNYGFISSGGAIYNAADAQTQNINSNFLANSASSALNLNFSDTAAYDNQPKTVKTKLDFKSNGGAIYNGGAIADINGNFIGNSSKNVLNSNISGNLGNTYDYYVSTDTLFENNFDSGGGALYNKGAVSNITGDFLSNSASNIVNSVSHDTSAGSNGNYYIGETNEIYSYGGAIYNAGTIGSLVSNFTGNYALAHENADITMSYTAGYFTISRNDNLYSYGGALYNAVGAVISELNGKFADNYTLSNLELTINTTRQSASSSGFAYSYGGALYNQGTIPTIIADFTNNHSIARVTKDFIPALSDSSIKDSDTYSDAYSYGGAIYNKAGASISSITGNFSDNSAEAVSNVTNTYQSQVQAYGGAIYTYNNAVNNINGDFTNNSAIASLNTKGEGYGYGFMVNAHGGAIYGGGFESESFTGDFLNNKAEASFNADNIVKNISISANSSAGAVSANAKKITGDFIGNSAVSKGRIKLYNEANNNNYSAYATASSRTGALSGAFDTIKGNFENNKASSVMDVTVSSNDKNSLRYNVSSYGGAFAGNVKDLEGSFSNNSAEAILNLTFEGEGSSVNIQDDSSVKAESGAASIQNTHTETIKAVFSQNHTIAQGPYDALSLGGAVKVYNEYSGYYIKDFIADFSDNYAKAISGTKDAYAKGGALFHTTYGNVKDGESKIINLNSNFTKNYAFAQSDTGNAYAQGGAVHSIGDHGSYWEYDEGGMGGMGDSTEVENDSFAKIDNLSGNYNSNYAASNVQGSGGKSYAQGGAIYNGKLGIIDSVKGVFNDNNTSSNTVDSDSISLGGAIYNAGSIDTVEGTFSGNKATATSQTGVVSALGGAIYSEKSLTIKADNDTTLFSGNKTVTESNGIITEEENAVFMGNNDSNPDSELTLTLNAVNGGRIQFDDQISGGSVSDGKIVDGAYHYYNLKIDGDSTSQVLLNNDVKNAYITLDNTNLVMGREDIFDDSHLLTLNSGTIDMQNGQTGTVGIDNVTVNGNVNVKLDADLSGSGKMDNFASANVSGSGSLIIDSINIVKDMDEGVYSTVLDFVNSSSVTTALNVNDSSIMTSLYTYYLGLNDNNQIIFERTEDIGGLASALANKPPVTDYFITLDTEVLNGYSAIFGNEMQGNELNIHGNGNNLDGNGNIGILVNEGKTLRIDSVGTYTVSDAQKEDTGSFAKIDEKGKVSYHTVTYSKGITNFKDTGSYDNGGALTAKKADLQITQTVFSDNKTTTRSDNSYPSMGGAILSNNSNLIVDNSLFVNNSSESTFYTYGGAAAISGNGNAVIANSIFINNKTHSFTKPENEEYYYAQSEGGALYFNGFINNDSEQSGLEILNSSFEGNEAFSEQNHAFGGAVYLSAMKPGDAANSIDVNIKNSTFTNNIARVENGWLENASAQGGAIFTDYMSDFNLNITNSYFDGNIASSKMSNAKGGAIFVSGRGDRNIVNSIFTNNTALVDSSNESASALGGAIYTDTALNIAADNGLTLFSGNKTVQNGTEEQNAIYVDSMRGELTLNAKNNGVIQFDDTIKGGTYQYDSNGGKWLEDLEHSYNLNITGDSTGKVLLNNSVKNAKVTVDTVNLNLGRNDVFADSDVTVNSGTLGFINNNAEAQTMHSLNINGNVNLALDVDLAGERMDTLPDGTIVSSDSQIGVSYLNLLNDAVKDKTIIEFAPEDYANRIQYTGENPIAYSKIYKYDVGYQINPDSKLGEFIFARGSSSNPSDNYNPSVLPAPVTTQTGGYTTQLQTFNYAFQHSDSFMNIPYLDRMTIKNRNKYAISPTGDATDVGTFSPLLTHDESAGFWIKPYASFESVPLKNGPSVSNINYGTLVGYDSSMKSIAKGFDRVVTGYIGYNGASQRYSGVDAYQNGGLIGSTVTLYKGNFFNATTASVGATVGDATGMYGSENYTMLLAGIANKTGYNFEFFKGKMILQPSMLISYSFVNTFDYTNAAGLRIKSDPLNAIQLAPGVKLIGNTKNGWQPYIGVSMVWNLLDKTKVTANDVRLPEMSIRPYVQYGVGIQKKFQDRFTAYGQAMVHSGGRNGISLSAGFRWAVGKK